MARLTLIPIGIGLLFSTMGCQAPPDPDLKQASAALRKMATDASLAKSCFSVAYPNGGTSEFVDYLFSDLGSAEWPISFDPLEMEQMEAIEQPPWPDGVVASRFERRQLEMKELVLQPDDGKRVVVAKGYLAGSRTVVFEDQWAVGQAVASEGTRQICESNLEMGISPIPQEY